MSSERCPQCSGTQVLLNCAFKGQGDYGVRFVPTGVLTTPWDLGAFASSDFTGFRLCLSCGHLWSRLNPGRVRTLIATHGTKLGKQYLETVLNGPDHDLPDVPEARAAAEGVAQIDVLLIGHKTPEATRRLRELTGMTWDQAIAAVLGWSDYDRAKKLALLGWEPKEKANDGAAANQADPMRDRWIDG